jgi:hypothetical protein
MRRAIAALLVALVVAAPAVSEAAPPDPASAPADAHAPLRGRVRERGPERSPVSGAVVLLVAAPPDVRPGATAEPPLDPDSVTWMLRVETDSEGRFELAEVPIGKLRVIVITGGYDRLEQWAVLERDGGGKGELDLWLEPERGGTYRTEVVTTRLDTAFELPPQRTLSGEAARRYPGSGDDPMLGALNLPGVARSPAGLGLFSFRGGDPNEVGVYVDGHPVPRAFHVLPIASVVAAPLVDQISIDPGNYATAFGGFGGGLVRIDSRRGGRDRIHGRAHVDLFDAGATLDGPVGKGSAAVGIRRSHVGDLLRLLPLQQLIAPNFWDYLARFDHPVGRGHTLGLRALGAGDRLLLNEFFDFRASFHRFDLDYRFRNDRWQVLVSPSLRLERISLVRVGHNRRDAQVFSARTTARWQRFDWFALEFGADVVAEHWRRHIQYIAVTMDADGDWLPDPLLPDPPPDRSSGDTLRLGAWLGMPLYLRDYSLIPSLRVNVFGYGAGPLLRVDPRISLRGPLAGPVRLLAAAGLYGVPVVGGREEPSGGYLEQGGDFQGGVADIPEYLLTYFDPNIAGEAIGRAVSTTHVVHASAGFEADLPAALQLHALGFYRASGSVKFENEVGAKEIPDVGRRRSAGLELMLRRSPTAAGKVVDGWLGYTLLMARVEDPRRQQWQAALFDQRHNFVALLGFALPRNFRLGLRFRVGSGNPERPITGREVTQNPSGFEYRPLRAARGTSYQPLFHQLDIRLDKRWVLRRTSVSAYLDVQNVYNRTYPEIWIYSADWSYRQAAIGLPIYPSLGVEVMY